LTTRLLPCKVTYKASRTTQEGVVYAFRPGDAVRVAAGASAPPRAVVVAHSDEVGEVGAVSYRDINGPFTYLVYFGEGSWTDVVTLYENELELAFQ
jgi:hypothetical protein